MIISALIFTGVWAALWDTPEADLSLARLHITSPAGSIQNRPKFSVNLSGLTTLTYLYLEDTVSERTSSLPMISVYPEAQVSLRFGKFELGFSGEQTLGVPPLPQREGVVQVRHKEPPPRQGGQVRQLQGHRRRQRAQDS